MNNTVYKIINIQPENKKYNSFETYDVLTLKDSNGLKQELHLGFYQNREAFRFSVANYEDFVSFINKQSLPEGYDITNLGNIQDLIHTYEDSI